jgi:hypothetical protein
MGQEKPWWADDPEIAAIRRGVMEDIERAGREPFRPDVPDPVLADILSGASVRELSVARDDLAAPMPAMRTRYERAAPPGSPGAKSAESSASRGSSCTAASADPRRQQLLEHSGVADGVSTEVVVEVDDHPPAFCMPFGDAVGPLAQLVVRV